MDVNGLLCLLFSPLTLLLLSVCCLSGAETEGRSEYGAVPDRGTRLCFCTLRIVGRDADQWIARTLRVHAFLALFFQAWHRDAFSTFGNNDTGHVKSALAAVKQHRW